MYNRSTARRRTIQNPMALLFGITTFMCILLCCIMLNMVVDLQNQVTTLATAHAATEAAVTNIETKVANSTIIEEPVIQGPVYENTQPETEAPPIVTPVEPVPIVVATGVYNLSGMTAEQIDTMILSTLAFYKIDPAQSVITGMGEIFYKAETEYGINSTALLGLIQRESGLATSNYARATNNITSNCYYDKVSGKMLLIPYASLEENIMATAKLLATTYREGKGCNTIQEIGRSYCPANANWGNEVEAYANVFISCAPQFVE